MRGKRAPIRKILPDVKFKSLELHRFINQVMKSGKKTIAQKIVYGAFDIIKEKTKKEPLKVFEEAVKKVSPQMEVRTRRVGGANYQIPFPVRGDRQNTLAYRWLISAAKDRKGKPMQEKLAEEILAAANGEGSAIKKRDDVHKMAESNKAFAHFAKFG